MANAEPLFVFEEQWIRLDHILRALLRGDLFTRNGGAIGEISSKPDRSYRGIGRNHCRPLKPIKEE